MKDNYWSGYTFGITFCKEKIKDHSEKNHGKNDPS